MGFANIKEIKDIDMDFAISIAVKIPKEVIQGIKNGPTIEYYNQYKILNKKLDNIALFCEEYLKLIGYKAFAQTVERVKEFGNYRTILPHKTVATRAGLGWIGKNALLITKEYGSAIRITSIITNAPLECGEPIIESRCGQCLNCTISCPGKAILGKLWNVNLDRDEFFSPLDCRKAARKIAKERIDKEITLCGKCIEVCPYTKRYVD